MGGINHQNLVVYYCYTHIIILYMYICGNIWTYMETCMEILLETYMDIHGNMYGNTWNYMDLYENIWKYMVKSSVEFVSHWWYGRWSYQTLLQNLTGLVPSIINHKPTIMRVIPSCFPPPCPKEMLVTMQYWRWRVIRTHIHFGNDGWGQTSSNISEHSRGWTLG